MRIEILGKVSDIQTIAVGKKIRELERLKKVYGPGHWKKRKGVVRVRLPDGAVVRGEVHWYEAHGIGRVELKLKRVLSNDETS
ncbi:MAG: hypothetical protein ACREAA_19625 [Candidatus Polarisedimenticolia bacterium]